MTNNTPLDTSLCMEKQQSFGALRKNQLWRFILVRPIILWRLCVGGGGVFCQVVWLLNLTKKLCIEKYKVVTLRL